MSLDIFSPAAGADELTYCRTEDAEPAYCDSLLWLPPDPKRKGPQSLRCPLDADHLHDRFDARHGRGLTRWTTADAARSLADFGPRPASGPMCDACDIRPARGLCRACFAAEERDENRETESEDAA